MNSFFSEGKHCCRLITGTIETTFFERTRGGGSDKEDGGHTQHTSSYIAMGVDP